MRVLLAFDKFKHALGATEACAAAAAAVRDRDAAARLDEAPLADGGEGFCEILTRAASGKLVIHEVCGPRFAPLAAHFGIVELEKIPAAARTRLDLPNHGRLAIIELAQASGLDRLAPAERDPWLTSSYGTGQLLARAADAGVRAALLGIGGSATNDVGLGALEAIGLEFRDPAGSPLTRITPARFGDLARLAGELWPHIPDLRIACDVRNALVGPNGATAIFGPQKGLRPEDFTRLERTVGTLAKKLCAHFDQPRTHMMEPGAGAAGGFAFGFRVACAAKLVPGFALVSDWLQLEERIKTADLVLTGEGRFDHTSLSGKGPGAVAELALRHGKQLAVLAGSVDDSAAAALRSLAQKIAQASGLPERRLSIVALSTPGEPPESYLPATASRLAQKIKAIL